MVEQETPEYSNSRLLRRRSWGALQSDQLLQLDTVAPILHQRNNALVMPNQTIAGHATDCNEKSLCTRSLVAEGGTERIEGHSRAFWMDPVQSQ
jgi:hypothetical protein